ncbi:MAG: RdgB/HAM1 family non-canonical purine NTP pyrophosphatase [Verrucomicrobiota bacterium]
MRKARKFLGFESAILTRIPEIRIGFWLLGGRVLWKFGRMPQLLIATKNAHKTQEIRAMLGEAWALSDLCQYSEIPAPEENGVTFSQNAAIKAVEASKLFPGWVLADDSGLAVDALHGAPGVISARFAGPDASDADNREKLLRDMAGFPDASQRTARFHCVLALAFGGDVKALFQGVVEGHLLGEEQGSGGFGYDPLFVPEGHSDSFGVLPATVKNAMSHRSRALEAFRQWVLVNSSIL